MRSRIAGCCAGRRPLLRTVVAMAVAVVGHHLLRRVVIQLFAAPNGILVGLAVPTQLSAGTYLARRAVSDDGFSPSASSSKKAGVGRDEKLKEQPPVSPLEEEEVGAPQGLPRIRDDDVGKKVGPAITALVLTLVVLAAVSVGVIGGLKQAAKDRQALGGPPPESAALITTRGSTRR
uniref:Uncharacterized protein n=1 Tax=Alexandrium monilatum TaxID=311494 RepID=A0A7S4SXA3_9DINO|mmetsp:Transcript_106788/g.319262  ORF Transcript_106788/g.319262 Transcript_106788/m.319262 type:complete len:177 (+) Transcript_106788:84-614(+)